MAEPRSNTAAERLFEGTSVLEPAMQDDESAENNLSASDRLFAGVGRDAAEQAESPAERLFAGVGDSTLPEPAIQPEPLSVSPVEAEPKSEATLEPKATQKPQPDAETDQEKTARPSVLDGVVKKHLAPTKPSLRTALPTEGQPPSEDEMDTAEKERLAKLARTDLIAEEQRMEQMSDARGDMTEDDMRTLRLLPDELKRRRKLQARVRIGALEYNQKSKSVWGMGVANTGRGILRLGLRAHHYSPLPRLLGYHDELGQLREKMATPIEDETEIAAMLYAPAKLGQQFVVQRTRGVVGFAATAPRAVSHVSKKLVGETQYSRLVDSITDWADNPTTAEKEVQGWLQEEAESYSKRALSVRKQAAELKAKGKNEEAERLEARADEILRQKATFEATDKGASIAIGLLQLMMDTSLMAKVPMPGSATAAQTTKTGRVIAKALGPGAKYIVPGLNKSRTAIVKTALARGLLSYVTTPGTQKEKAQSAGLTIAYLMTPFASSAVPKAPVLADIGLNTLITSFVAGGHGDAWEQAKREQPNNLAERMKLFATLALPDTLADIFGSLGTRSIPWKQAESVARAKVATMPDGDEINRQMEPILEQSRIPVDEVRIEGDIPPKVSERIQLKKNNLDPETEKIIDASVYGDTPKEPASAEAIRAECREYERKLAESLGGRADRIDVADDPLSPIALQREMQVELPRYQLWEVARRLNDHLPPSKRINKTLSKDNMAVAVAEGIAAFRDDVDRIFASGETTVKEAREIAQVMNKVLPPDERVNMKLSGQDLFDAVDTRLPLLDKELVPLIEQNIPRTDVERMANTANELLSEGEQVQFRVTDPETGKKRTVGQAELLEQLRAKSELVKPATTRSLRLIERAEQDSSLDATKLDQIRLAKTGQRSGDSKDMTQQEAAAYLTTLRNTERYIKADAAKKPKNRFRLPNGLLNAKVARSAFRQLRRVGSYLTLSSANLVDISQGKDVRALVFQRLQRAEARAAGRLQEMTFSAEGVNKSVRELGKLLSEYDDSVLKDFMTSRGTPHGDSAIALQRAADTRLAEKAPELHALMPYFQKLSDWLFAEAQKIDPDIKYRQDYWLGLWKDDSAQALRRLFASTRFTKTKQYPSFADGLAAKAEPRIVNPLENLTREYMMIERVRAMRDLREDLKTGVVDNKMLAVPEEKASGYTRKWQKVDDPQFDGLLVEPDTARMINKLISHNKVMSDKTLKGIRKSYQLIGAMKFMLPLHHTRTITTQSLVMGTGVPLWTKGKFTAPPNVFDGRHVNDKYGVAKHERYVAAGGASKGSFERETQGLVQKMIRVIPNPAVRKGMSAATGYSRWLFDVAIPRTKEAMWQRMVFEKEQKLGRELTYKEDQLVARDLDNIFGEMNEQLHGRSRTATTVLRLFKLAPGFSEGNIRTNLGLFKGNTTSWKNVPTAMVGAAMFAMVVRGLFHGPSAMVPEAPAADASDDEWIDYVRDFYKIDTGYTDTQDRPIVMDLMTYEKDYWDMSVEPLLMLATGKPKAAAKQALGNYARRIWGSEAPVTGIARDVYALSAGERLTDRYGNPINYQHDSGWEKLLNIVYREADRVSPIPFETYERMEQRGLPNGMAMALACLAIRANYTEEDRDLNKIHYAMRDAGKERRDIYALLPHLDNPRRAIASYNNNVQRVLDSDYVTDELKKERGWTKDRMLLDVDEMLVNMSWQLTNPSLDNRKRENIVAGLKNLGYDRADAARAIYRHTPPSGGLHQMSTLTGRATRLGSRWKD